MYRFDFALTSAEGTSQPTAFTLNLEEWNKGEIRLGKNAALVPGGSARQDVGLRVVTEFRTVEENVLLDVETEVSRIDSPTVHKMSVKSKALLAPNRPTVVATVEDGSGRFQLMVTSTRLR